MSEKRSEGRVNITADPRNEMHTLVRRAAGPHAPWKVRVATAARALGLSFSRAKDFYYGDARVRVSAEELERARSRLSRGNYDTPAALARRLRDRLDDLDRTRNEIADILAQLDRDGDSHRGHRQG